MTWLFCGGKRRKRQSSSQALAVVQVRQDGDLNWDGSHGDGDNWMDLFRF